MKIGLDIHGVIDSDPAFFSEFTKSMRYIGNEIHILTGQEDSHKLRAQLKNWKIKYDHLFSISSSLIEYGYIVKRDKNGNPWFDDELWNSAKGHYCEIMKIDLHFDDSPEYFEYFETPYVFYTQKKIPINRYVNSIEKTD